MMDPPRILAVIPARGGSKGIPRKNIQPIGGRSLLQWAIDVARASGVCTDIVVSTDDLVIQEEAIRVGAACPFLRPVELAADTTPTYPVVAHALVEMERRAGRRYDLVLTLNPTAPFRTDEDVRAALRLLVDSGAPSVVSVAKLEDPHPEKVHRIVEGRLHTYIGQRPGVCHVRRQDLPPAYRLNGAMYLSRREVLDRAWVAEDAVPYVMPEMRSVNIDAPIDLAFARWLFERGEVSGYAPQVAAAVGKRA